MVINYFRVYLIYVVVIVMSVFVIVLYGLGGS